MSKIYLHNITGSHMFNIQIETSDIDYIIINADKRNIFKQVINNQDIHYRNAETFMKLLFHTEGATNCMYNVGYLFTIPVVETKLSTYIIQHREELIASNLPYYEACLSRTIKALSKQHVGIDNCKRTAYALIWLNAYIQYATKNISFEEALKLPQDLYSFIMDMRSKRVPHEEQIKKLNSMLQQAEAVKEFYNKEPDLETFYRIESEMKAILNIT